MWLIHLILQTWPFSPEWLSLCTPLSQLQDFIFLCEIRLGFNFHLSVKRMVRLRGWVGGVGWQMPFSSSLSYTQTGGKVKHVFASELTTTTQQSLASYPSSPAPIIPVLPYFWFLPTRRDISLCPSCV